MSRRHRRLQSIGGSEYHSLQELSSRHQRDQERSEYIRKNRGDANLRSSQVVTGNANISDFIEHKWVEYFDERTQRNFYYNPRTKKSVWEIPNELTIAEQNRDEEIALETRKAAAGSLEEENYDDDDDDDDEEEEPFDGNNLNEQDISENKLMMAASERFKNYETFDAMLSSPSGGERGTVSSSTQLLANWRTDLSQLEKVYKKSNQMNSTVAERQSLKGNDDIVWTANNYSSRNSVLQTLSQVISSDPYHRNSSSPSISSKGVIVDGMKTNKDHLISRPVQSTVLDIVDRSGQQITSDQVGELCHSLASGSTPSSPHSPSTTSSGISSSTLVRELYLEECGLTDKELLILSHAFGKAKKLQTISLAGNALTQISCMFLCNALKDNHSIQELNLRGNNLTDKGVTEIAKNILTSGLQVLDLTNVQMTTNGAKALLSALLELQHHNKTRFSSFFLAFEGNPGIERKLQKQLSKLCPSKRPFPTSGRRRSLSTSNNNTKTEATSNNKNVNMPNSPVDRKVSSEDGSRETLMWALEESKSAHEAIFANPSLICTDKELSPKMFLTKVVKVARDTKQLTTLILENCGLTDKLLLSLSSMAIAENASLRKISIAQNNVTKKGIKYFAKAVLLHGGIVFINVSDNFIGDEGCSSLCSCVVSSNCAISELHLNGTGITDKGVRTLASAIMFKKGPKVIMDQIHFFPSLHLNRNHITSVGTKIISLLCSRNPSIQTIKIADNQIGDEGVMNLINMIKMRDTEGKLLINLRHLDISRNQISTFALGELFTALGKGKHDSVLETLAVGGNGPLPEIMPTKDKGDDNKTQEKGGASQEEGQASSHHNFVVDVLETRTERNERAESWRRGTLNAAMNASILDIASKIEGKKQEVNIISENERASLSVLDELEHTADLHFLESLHVG
eukprot:g2204.t1